jgi:hypothetical protein
VALLKSAVIRAGIRKFEISGSSVKDLAGGLVVIEWGELIFYLD